MHNFLQEEALEREHRDETVVLALVKHDVVAVESVIVNIQLVEQLITRRALLHLQVARDVHEPQVTAHLNERELTRQYPAECGPPSHAG